MLNEKLCIMPPYPQEKHTDCMRCSNNTTKDEEKLQYFCKTCKTTPFFDISDCFK